MTNNRAEALGLRVPESRDLVNFDTLPDETADRLRALVPDVIYGPDPDGVSGYVMRDVDGVRDLDVFSHAADLGLNVLLSGPTGSAKTSAARAFAAVHGLPFVAVAVNGGIDPASVWGRWTVAADKSLVWIDSPAALVVRHGGVLVFDELNMAHPRVMAAFYGLLDVRRTLTIAENGGETVRAHRGLLIVATMNPNYEGTARLNGALARRFAWSLLWDYDADVEAVLVPSPALREFARAVRELPEVRTDLSTDALMAFVDTASAVGTRFAAGRLVAAFTESERGGVARALELRLPTIAGELGLDTEGGE